jgi:hypothetical protein
VTEVDWYRLDAAYRGFIAFLITRERQRGKSPSLEQTLFLRPEDKRAPVLKYALTVGFFKSELPLQSKTVGWLVWTSFVEKEEAEGIGSSFKNLYLSDEVETRVPGGKREKFKSWALWYQARFFVA